MAIINNEQSLEMTFTLHELELLEMHIYNAYELDYSIADGQDLELLEKRFQEALQTVAKRGEKV